MKNSRRFNMDALLKILLLFGFSVFFLIVICTGSVSLYVHPRIIPYMFFASAAMIMIAILLLRKLFEPGNIKANSWHLLFFIIPLLMAFALPAKSFDSSAGTLGDVQLSDNTAKPVQEMKEADIPAESSMGSTTSDTGDTAASDATDEGNLIKNGTLVMNSSNFYKCLCEIYADMDKYVGTKIEVIGFVYSDNEDFAENEFVPARLMMVCCAADMQPVGFLCQYDKASELESYAWVKVCGTLEKAGFDGETIPCIKAESVEEAEKPVEEYIYPY